jgi:hypothetical protein
VAVFTNVASLPDAYRLYLPHVWIDDPARRQQIAVPDRFFLATKPRIAFMQLCGATPRGALNAVESWLTQVMETTGRSVTALSNSGCSLCGHPIELENVSFCALAIRPFHLWRAVG